jgi:hypothetical protein
VRIDAVLQSAGAPIVGRRNVLVFPASTVHSGRADTPLLQVKFLLLASQCFFPNFRGCLQGTTWCPPTFRVFYCRPFKGKPGASRGRKASGL